MKKITINREYEVYEFNELTSEAKSRAINDVLMSITDAPELYPELKEEINKAQDKCDKLYTPWFFATYLWEFAEETILEILQQSVYLKDGTFFDEGGEQR